MSRSTQHRGVPHNFMRLSAFLVHYVLSGSDPHVRCSIHLSITCTTAYCLIRSLCRSTSAAGVGTTPKNVCHIGYAHSRGYYQQRHSSNRTLLYTFQTVPSSVGGVVWIVCSIFVSKTFKNILKHAPLWCVTANTGGNKIRLFCVREII